MFFDLWVLEWLNKKAWHFLGKNEEYLDQLGKEESIYKREKLIEKIKRTQKIVDIIQQEENRILDKIG